MRKSFTNSYQLYFFSLIYRIAIVLFHCHPHHRGGREEKLQRKKKKLNQIIPAGARAGSFFDGGM